MSGVNKVILLGNLGRDPEVRFMPNGGAVANLAIATSETWKDKQTGEAKEKTEWHRVAMFGKLAEIAGEYLKKGSKIYLEGQLQTRKWQNQQGQDQYTTEIVVQGYNGTMQMLDKNPNAQASGANQNQAQANGHNQAQASAQPSQQLAAKRQAQVNQNQAQANPGQANQAGFQQSPTIDFDDDIPFDRLCRKPMMHLCC